jgi:hypothetical protein
MHWPQDRRDDHIETSAQRVIRRVTHNLGDCITPLMDDACAIDGHAGAQIGRLGSVHALFTISPGPRFTDAVVRPTTL